MAVASEAPASYRSSAARPGALALIRQGFQDVASRRRLIRYLVQTDLKKKGADTLLGNIWWVIDPLLQMLVYYVLVSIIFQRKQEDFALFVFCAILPWKWFTSAITDGTSSVVAMEKLIKQINFPKIVLPTASVVAGIANFFFGLIPLAAMIVLLYPDRASGWLALIPVVAAVQLLFTLPLALILSAINVFYRDVGNLARHVLRLAFYASPGIYSIELIYDVAGDNPLLGNLLLANPFAILFTAYRDLIYDGRAPDWLALGILSLVSIAMLVIAVFTFKRLEPSFAKVL
jgi:lipopolysaccharide transport system permease protein/teichoic acid transport system permease protein